MKKKNKANGSKENNVVELSSNIDNLKWLAFIEAYVIHMNATKAYMEAYPDVTYNTARANGAALLANTNIKDEIKKRLKQKIMGGEEILARLSDYAKATLLPFIKIDIDGFVFFDFSHPEAKNNIHLIKKIKTKRQRHFIKVGRKEAPEIWQGEWVEIELHDPQKALEMMAKYHHLIEDVPSKVTVELNIDKAVDRLEQLFEIARMRKQAGAKTIDAGANQ